MEVPTPEEAPDKEVDPIVQENEAPDGVELNRILVAVPEQIESSKTVAVIKGN